MANSRLCSIAECGNPNLARGYCSAHWQKWKRYGDPMGAAPNPVWSDDKIAILRDRYPHMATKDLIEQFLPDHTVAAVHGIAKTLGLRKTEEARRERYDRELGKTPWNKVGTVSFVCEACGVDFQTAPRRVKDGSVRHCSRACSHQAKRMVTGTDHPLYSQVDRTCEWCGGAFKAKPAKVKAGEAKFCGRSCAGANSAFNQDGRRSSIELAVEAELTKRGVVFVPQKKMAHFLCDFYLPDLRVVIECDGDYWHSRPEVVERDKRKDAWLLSHGQKIVRLREKDIKVDCVGCVDRALAA